MSDDGKYTRLTLRLGPEAMKTVNDIKEKRGVSIAEVFRRAIATEKFLLDRIDNGEVIILEDPKTEKQSILHLR